MSENPRRKLWLLIPLALSAAIGPCLVLIGAWSSGFVAINARRWSSAVIQLELGYTALLISGLAMSYAAFIAGPRNARQLAIAFSMAIVLLAVSALLFPGPIPLE